MDFLHILILGLVQGAAELLPVSSSAHVIVAEKLMGLDPSSPENSFLLVMLHTGTMFAVIVYFWNSWLDHYCSDATRLWDSIKNIAVATIITVIVGFVLKIIIEKVFMHGQAKAEVEELFSNLPLIGGALLAAGLLIIYSGSSEEKQPGTSRVDVMGAAAIGAVQGLCLPFRGFSRSGGTISAGLLMGVERRQIEEFSFALAVVLTPFVAGVELWRLIKAHPEITHGSALINLFKPGLLGMVCSFVAGYLALKLLSRLLEAGRWKYFGFYCLVASAVVFGLAYEETTAAASTPSSAAVTNEAPIPVMNASSPATLMPASTPTNTGVYNGSTVVTSGTDTVTSISATNAAPVPSAVPATNAESAPMAPGTNATNTAPTP